MPSEISLDENTTAGDLVALVSEEEVACLIAQVGPEALAAMQSAPLVSLTDEIEVFASCISPELFAMISEAMMGLMGGPELSPESAACVADFHAEYGTTPPDGSDIAADLAYTFNYLMCLTDEEAMALSGGEDGAPLPSQLRCLTAQMDQETLFLLLSSVEDIFTGSASPEVMQAMQEVQIASVACEVDLFSLAG